MPLPQETLFQISMRWRIIYGALRIVLGLAVLKVIGTPFIDIVTTLMGHELTQDPNDLLYSFVTYILAGHHAYEASYFIAFYLFFWGAVDIILSYNLIKHRLWAFPVSIVLIGSFVTYEIYRFTHTHSLILLGVIGIDIIILWLVTREYRKLQPVVN